MARPQQITITGTVAAGTAGQMISDAATVTSNTGDPDQTNNTATFNQVVGPVADVAISKQALESDGTTPVTTPLAVGRERSSTPLDRDQPRAERSGMRSTVTDPLPTGITLDGTAPGCTPGAGRAARSRARSARSPRAQPFRSTSMCIVGAAASNIAPTNTATVSSTTADPEPVGQLGQRDRRGRAGRQPRDREDRLTRRRRTSVTT